MLNKLQSFLRRYDMLHAGDTVVCAVSGGADSVALLFAMYLLRSKLGITVEAAHFNHHLRGDESDRDEEFVKELCDRFNITLHLAGEQVKSGKKGLEAAARDARYGFLKTLPGVIATAHTADDNAETLLMHMVRGTGLKGLGAIAPVSGNLIRPMLSITRVEILAFLQEYHLSYVQDSSNDTDAFLRNRLRRHVMPLLKEENPQLAENLSAMALRLREDEAVLSTLARTDGDVNALRRLPGALRSRALAAFLEKNGVFEPEASHIALAEKLVFSPNPSARGNFPGNVVITRNYDRLEKLEAQPLMEEMLLPCPGEVMFGNIRILCAPAQTLADSRDRFTVSATGTIRVRSRRSGDAMRTAGGTKSLKKLFVDAKIPAARRLQIPVITDEDGVLGTYGFGANKNKLAETLPAVDIRFEITKEKRE